MKNRVFIVVMVCLTALAVVFCGLWLREKNDRSDLRRLAQAGCGDAYDQFAEYRSSGDESAYWSGVAAFRSFEQAYKLLTEGTNKADNYLYCNEVYGSLVSNPETSREHIDELIDALNILRQNVEDGTGYLRMSELRNSIGE